MHGAQGAPFYGGWIEHSVVKKRERRKERRNTNIDKMKDKSFAKK